MPTLATATRTPDPNRDVLGLGLRDEIGERFEDPLHELFGVVREALFRSLLLVRQRIPMMRTLTRWVNRFFVCRIRTVSDTLRK